MTNTSSAHLNGPTALEQHADLDNVGLAPELHQVINGPLPITHPHPVVERYRDTLEREGYAFEAGANIRSALSAHALQWIGMAREAGRNAPVDKNRGGQEAGRHRHYSPGLYYRRAAAGRRFQPSPPFVDAAGREFTTYMQPPGMNRDYGAERQFEPLPPSLLSHEGLQDVVDICFQATPSSLFPNEARDSLKAAVHLICLKAKGERPGISSPNRAHVDGELSTTILLLDRVNVIGGGSLVVERRFADTHPNEIPFEARRADFTLDQTLDMLTVDDRRLAHYVFPVFARANTKGYRTVLLVDFTPLVPETSDQLLNRE